MYTYTHSHTCTHAHTQTHARVRIHARIHTCINAYTCSHTHSHTYLCTQSKSVSRKPSLLMADKEKPFWTRNISSVLRRDRDLLDKIGDQFQKVDGAQGEIKFVQLGIIMWKLTSASKVVLILLYCAAP